MRKLDYTSQFRKDIKRCEKRGKDFNKSKIVTDALQRGRPLPPRCRPHKLSGDWAEHWECHIEPDWLLIYRITEDAVLLVRTGTHADLFD